MPRFASSRVQPVPHGQTTWSTALSGLDGPSDITTRLSLIGCSASVLGRPSPGSTATLPEPSCCLAPSVLPPRRTGWVNKEEC